ncbi:MAG: hypothetical protein QM811_02825 [Pirellulales bacterium]
MNARSVVTLLTCVGLVCALASDAAAADPPVDLAELRAGLRSADENVRWRTFKAIEQAKPVALLDDLVDTLRHPDARTARRAIDMLTAYGPAAAPTWPRLQALIEDKTYPDGDQLIAVVGGWGDAGASAVPWLTAHYKADGARFPNHAANALGRLGVEAPLLTGFDDANRNRRNMALVAAEFFPRHSPAIVAGLLKHARVAGDDDATDHQSARALKSLGAVRPTSHEIEAALRAEVGSTRSIRRHAAIAALARVEPQSAETTRLLRESAIGSDPYVARQAQLGLSRANLTAAERLEILLDIVHHNTDFGATPESIMAAPDESFALLQTLIVDDQTPAARRVTASLALGFVAGRGLFWRQPAINTPADAQAFRAAHDRRASEIRALTERIFVDPHVPPAIRGAALLANWRAEGDRYSRRDRFRDAPRCSAWLDAMRQRESLLLKILAAEYVRYADYDLVAEDTQRAMVLELAACAVDADPRLRKESLVSMRSFGTAADPALDALFRGAAGTRSGPATGDRSRHRRDRHASGNQHAALGPHGRRR